MKTILLHADSSPRMPARLALACDLADRYDAQVLALYAVSPLVPQVDTAFNEVAFSDDLPQQCATIRSARADRLFELTAGRNVPRVTWAEVTREPVLDCVVQQALYSDLLVLGQHSAIEDHPGMPADFLASLLIASGKPAYIVPTAGRVCAAPARVLIGWKPSRETARAVSAALPFLQNAATVSVAVWQRIVTDVPVDTVPIVRYLRAHGVEPRYLQFADRHRHVGDALLALAHELDADLLVMGCYGHTPARELLLGGSTRTVLRDMKLPVLMAH